MPFIRSTVHLRLLLYKHFREHSSKIKYILHNAGNRGKRKVYLAFLGRILKTTWLLIVSVWEHVAFS